MKRPGDGVSAATRTRLIWRGGKKVRAHRWIMEQHLGRKLLPTEHVHHKDGNPLNNDLSNLEVLGRWEHMVLHKMKPIATRPCAWCGTPFTPDVGDPKRQSRKCCSTSCASQVKVDAALRSRGLRP